MKNLFNIIYTSYFFTQDFSPEFFILASVLFKSNSELFYICLFLFHVLLFFVLCVKLPVTPEALPLGELARERLRGRGC